MRRLDQIPQEYIERRRTRLFIGRNEENRPIDAFNPHQRSRLDISKRDEMPLRPIPKVEIFNLWGIDFIGPFLIFRWERVYFCGNGL